MTAKSQDFPVILHFKINTYMNSLPEWMTITPLAGKAGDTKLYVTCAENTGAARTAFLNFQCKSGKTVLLRVFQGAADRWVVNIRPDPVLANITIKENLAAFAVDAYHIDNATQDIEKVDNDDLASALVNNTPSDVLINWSPYGEINYCDYKFYNKDNASPNSCWNPAVKGTVFGRWVLNTVVQGGRPYFNLRNAAFHQGSPIVEIVFDTAGWHIYTLHALQNDTWENYRRVDITEASANGYVVTVSQGVIYSDMAGNSWTSNAIREAGRWQSAVNHAPTVNAITRVILNVASLAVANSAKFRVLKWYTDGNLLKVFISVGTTAQGGKFNPSAPFSASQVSSVIWDGTSMTPQSSTTSSMLRPEPFYNPA